MYTGRFFGFSLFAAFFIFGGILVSKSWNGVVYMTLNLEGDKRAPAAVSKQMIEMSVMRGTELLSAAKQRVLEDARVFEMGDDLGIELGHFFARNDEGDAKLACQYYDRVELVFVESGVTNSGVTPKMVVDGECSFDTQQVSRIKPLAIPVKRLMESETPTNMSYDYLAKTPVKLTFKDFGLSQSWPTEWDLVSVRFYVEQMGGRELLITAEDINSIRTSPFTMEWKNTNKRAVSSSH